MSGHPVFYISSESDDESQIVNDTWLNEGIAVFSEISEIKSEQIETLEHSECNIVFQLLYYKISC